MLPESRRPVEDRAALWQKLFINLPFLQLSPVVAGWKRPNNRWLEMRSRLTVENPDRDPGGFLSLGLGLIKAPTGNSVAELMLVNAVDRRVRDRVNLPEHLVPVVGYSTRIAHHQYVENERMWRQVL